MGLWAVLGVVSLGVGFSGLKWHLLRRTRWVLLLIVKLRLSVVSCVRPVLGSLSYRQSLQLLIDVATLVWLSTVWLVLKMWIMCALVKVMVGRLKRVRQRVW